MDSSSTKPSPRHIVLEAHVVAWLGNYVHSVKESIKRKALELSTQNTSVVKQSVPKYTASSHDRS